MFNQSENKYIKNRENVRFYDFQFSYLECYCNITQKIKTTNENGVHTETWEDEIEKVDYEITPIKALIVVPFIIYLKKINCILLYECNDEKKFSYIKLVKIDKGRRIKKISMML